MTTYYIEIREEQTDDNNWKPLEIYRKYVKDVAEAEKIYSEEASKFSNHKATFVDMKHDPDQSKVKTCIFKDIKNGKVVA